MGVRAPGMRVRGNEAAREARKRRTFAIISHPDAGKTTLTEKLLLYGGAVHLAGSVKARRALRHATSDWMEMERARGISVTSSVLRFEYGGLHINLLDTPGHQDFSEDTYRTLMAADSAVMLLDNRRGIEQQTRKLFRVSHLRRIPIFTFVNKCDRLGVGPLELLDGIEADLGIRCSPVTWPVTDGSGFLGVYDRDEESLHLYEKGTDHGQTRPAEHVTALGDGRVGALLGERARAVLEEEIELLDEAGSAFDRRAFLAGELSPVFFGSALTNFGVRPFLDWFVAHAPAPGAREAGGRPVEPGSGGLSAFVFKIQANMDPRHRDRIAFLRICSGHYRAGASVRNTRTGRAFRLGPPQQFFAREREAVETAWPGDVVGVLDRGSLRIGDTITSIPDVEFAAIPSFAPEHFARVRVADPLRRKHLDRGLDHLSEEGAVQLFFSGEGGTGPGPVVGAVGLLQFDVLVQRLASEYRVEATLETLPFRDARWVSGPEAEIHRVAGGDDCALVRDRRGRRLFLFRNGWVRERTAERAKQLNFRRVQGK